MEELLNNDEGKVTLKNADEGRQQRIADRVEEQAEAAVVQEAQATSERGMMEQNGNADDETGAKDQPERGDAMIEEPVHDPTARSSNEPIEIAIHTPIGSPSKSSEKKMDDAEDLEEGPVLVSEGRAVTPERPHAKKRIVEDEDESMGEQSEQRRTGEEQMIESAMDSDDARIIASAILNVDITEVYSPVRVAEGAMIYEKNLKKAIQHVEFCCILYRHQLKENRHVVHEHPWNAKSWKLECMKESIEDDRTSVAYTHMC